MNGAAKVGCLLLHASVFFLSAKAQVLGGPNYHTYNTALAACLDGAVENIYIGTKIATDILEEAKTEITCGLKGL